uniref:GST N-terminal domain-containing protein n=1 Tax=Romanomermis culicivorax TaxID=13658 RepID=A0A915I9D3_ROMCU
MTNAKFYAIRSVSGRDVSGQRISGSRLTGRPLYQMPVLYYGIGVPVAQSGAIMRFLAREHGLYSRSSERSAFIDQIYEATVDASAKYFNFTMSNNIPKADFVGTAKSELKKIQDLGFKHFSYPNLSNNLYIAGNK